MKSRASAVLAGALAGLTAGLVFGVLLWVSVVPVTLTNAALRST